MEIRKQYLGSILLCTVLFWRCTATHTLPKAAVVHSHNDYAQANPFFGAYDLQCGSIEADIFLKNGELIVAHEANEIKAGNTLKSLYLDPLTQKIKQNKKYPLQLLIDLKTPAHPTLDSLVKELQRFPTLISSQSPVQIVVSGSMPPPNEFQNYPKWIWFDGRFNQTYSAAQLERVAMFSTSFASLSRWKGDGVLTEAEKEKISKLVAESHSKGKKIRFWATPDIPTAWRELGNLKVDWIGTDTPQKVVDFLKNK